MNLPKECIEQLEKVREVGRKKYGNNGWELDVEMVTREDNLASIKRHFDKYAFKGMVLDTEDDMMNMAAVAYRALMECIRYTDKKDIPNE